MQKLWGTNKDCYVGKHNLEPESICSILIYLSEVCKTSTYKLSWMLFTDNKSSDTCKTMCPHTVPQSYFLLTMSLTDVVVRKQSLNHIILKQHRNISKGTAWQIMPWLSVVQLNETCFLAETSTCRRGRGEIECMKVEIFKKILFQLVF